MTGRMLWVDYLRSFIIVLVIGHHAALAYTTFAFFDQRRYINSTHPVVDEVRWVGLDVFVNFNDIFFMSLIFFISGLFVYKGLVQKGRRRFLKDRLIRLGIPFLVAELFIIPLAYIPAFLIDHEWNWQDFVIDYLSNQYWPVGPPWFIWLLLAFNIVVMIIPRGWYPAIFNAIAHERPWRFMLTAFILICLAYIPLTLLVGPYTWTGWGPFDFQLNRLLLYFVWFVFGVCLGAGDWEDLLFYNNKLFGWHWVWWLIICITCFTFEKLFSGAYFVVELLFVASCMASMLACMALFKAAVQRPLFFWNSLSANAYGIYLVHYVGITWLQFALLSYPFPVMVKFAMVWIGALAGSWLIVNWIRKVPVLKNVL